MSIEKRKHIRFSLDIPAVRFTKYGEKVNTSMTQISIGGCLIDWDETIYVGDEFRMLLELPDKNFLPLACKALYQSADNGIGAKFMDITRFEQELLTKIITAHLEKSGLPMQVDPFSQPPRTESAKSEVFDLRKSREEILENIMSSNK